MPELLIELFSEEIPARMQARGAEEFSRLVADALAPLSPRDARPYYGPRRIALAMALAGEVPASSSAERGPRVGASEAALAGFLRKHRATREQLREENGFYLLPTSRPAQPAAALVAAAVPGVLRRMSWPKSMRWGTHEFTWIRPLRRILCLLDGAPVHFVLDDAGALASGDETEGHRFMAPGAVAVSGVSDWMDTLRARRVIADQAERRARVASSVAAAVPAGHSVVPDEGLLDEVTGLVEWPVAFLGRIDDGFMDLPPEVMQVSMRVNQRYFALRDASGAAASYFMGVANIDAADGGKAIVAGNERVLRARFSDARYFWDTDRKQTLASRVPALDRITFHAKLGTQGERVRRLRPLARAVASMIGADATLADRAAALAKADLTTAMVGEFPELQGVIGSYYAREDGEPAQVARAIRDHYAPRGTADDLPADTLGAAVAIADRLDQLAAFFLIDERPSGSGDPFALRRAALGIIRIVRSNALRMPLWPLLESAVGGLDPSVSYIDLGAAVIDFIRERLFVQLRSEGASHEALKASFAGERDDDILRTATKCSFLVRFLTSDNGVNLLAGFKRLSNILRIEWSQPHMQGEEGQPVNPQLFTQPEEQALYDALLMAGNAGTLAAEEQYEIAFQQLGALRAPVDTFFAKVLVNDEQPEVRANRLRLLGFARRTMNAGAHFAAITG